MNANYMAVGVVVRHFCSGALAGISAFLQFSKVIYREKRILRHMSDIVDIVNSTISDFAAS